MNQLIKQINEYLELQLVPKTIVERVNRKGKIFYRRRTVMVHPQESVGGGIKRQIASIIPKFKIPAFKNVSTRTVESIYQKLFYAWQKVEKNQEGFASISDLAKTGHLSMQDTLAIITALQGKYPNKVEYSENKEYVKISLGDVK